MEVFGEGIAGYRKTQRGRAGGGAFIDADEGFMSRKGSDSIVPIRKETSMQHVMIDLYGCNSALLASETLLRRVLDEYSGPHRDGEGQPSFST